MNRFFFDVTGRQKVIFDYVGSEFKSPDGAVEFAQEKLALLKNSLNREWAGWSIEVRNVTGQKFCSIPIDDSDMPAIKNCSEPNFAFVS